MTKGECREQLLQLLGEGDSPADKTRHDALLGAALSAVAAAAGIPAERVIAPGEGRRDGDARLCPLPGDFARLSAVTRVRGGARAPLEGYSLCPQGLRLPLWLRDPAEVAYFRLPAPLPPDAPDSTPLDLPARVLPLLPLRWAVMAARPRDPEFAEGLMRDYLFELKQAGVYPLPPGAQVQPLYPIEMELTA